MAGDTDALQDSWALLERFDFIQAGETPTISYQPYDWSPALGRFRSADEEPTDEKASNHL